MLHKLGRGIFEEAPLESGPAELEAVFAANGLLAQHNGGSYSVRDSQVQLARAVHRALTEKRHLFAEAPCGTGKSIGYAVPAILTKKERMVPAIDAITGKTKLVPQPVVIVTANIALQEQLVTKDLPMLQKALNVPFTFGLLKGRQNYLCRAQLEYGNNSESRDDTQTQSSVSLLEAWSEITRTGDKSELDVEPPHNVWRRFSMSNEECSGSACAFYNDCFAYNAQRAAMASDIIVTNYHTLFADISLKRSVGVGILPEDCAVILDEAHEAAEIARGVLGGTLTLGGVLSALSAASKARLCAAGQYDKIAFSLFESLTRFAEGPNYEKRLKESDFGDTRRLADILGGLAERAENELSGGGLTTFERTALLSANKRASNAARILRLTADLPVAYAISLDLPRERNKTQSAIINVQVVEPGEILARSLFQRSAVVMTSATLTTQHSFTLVQGELGAPRDRSDYVDLPTPFDFLSQALLIVPEGLPDDPNSDDFKARMVEVLAETVRLARGRTLGLFTSYRNLRLAGDHLRSKRCPYQIYQQGDAPRTLLTQQFKNDTNSVLLGTTSFWTGVDVPGEALSCVFIDKLPFPEMSNPVMDALAEKYDDWFFRFSLPRAIMTFRQGAGRLIRATSDRGVIVVLDQRLRTKKYGSAFIQSLPKMRVSNQLNDITSMI
jgi:ATP-dependent DNA helicase DinG